MDKNYPFFNYFHFLVLVNLLSLGGKNDYLEITSTEISKTINCSQQTASKILIDLEQENLISRIKNNKRFKIKVTVEGYEVIKDIYEMIKRSLEKSVNSYVIFKGKIVTGMGEGAYYMSIEGYLKQFQEKLGYKPFPGTLNVKLEEKIYIDSKRELINFPSIYIEGFRNTSRSFGWVKCYPVKITTENENLTNDPSQNDGKLTGAHILLLERTHHDNSLIEVIAPYSIKECAKLKDGDRISLKLIKG